MTDQEKALEGMIEFCKWLLPNAERFGLTESQSIKALSQAQTPDDIVNGMNSLYEEIGEEKFKALTHDFQQSKNTIKKASAGTKIDYLVNKFAPGGPIETIVYRDYKQPTDSELFDRAARFRGMNNGRIVTILPDGSRIFDDAIQHRGARYERTVGPSADTFYTVYPNSGTSPRIDIYKNNGTYSDIYGGLRNISQDSVQMFTNRINELLNR